MNRLHKTYHADGIWLRTTGQPDGIPRGDTANGREYSKICLEDKYLCRPKKNKSLDWKDKMQ